MVQYIEGEETCPDNFFFSVEEMDDANNPASNVARAIVAAFDWNTTPDARKAAVAYLDSVIYLFVLVFLFFGIVVKQLRVIILTWFSDMG